MSDEDKPRRRPLKGHVFLPESGLTIEDLYGTPPFHDDAVPVTIWGNGPAHRIPTEFWSNPAWSDTAIETGWAEVELPHSRLDDQDQEGWLYVPAGKCAASSTAASWPERISACGVELSPFVSFMLEAHIAINAGRGPGLSRVPTDDIKEWINDNWRDELYGKRSDRLINAMATLLRHPDHKKGGNF